MMPGMVAFAGMVVIIACQESFRTRMILGGTLAVISAITVLFLTDYSKCSNYITSYFADTI